MTTEQAPDKCPFCGAGIHIEKDGSQCRAPRGSWVKFSCFTTWHHGYHDERRLQSIPCLVAERERLARERDEAIRDFNASQKSLEIATNQIAEMARNNNQLRARVKRLEEAGGLALGYAAKGDFESAAGVWTKAKEAKP